jgi:hypothetical protein
VGRAFSERATRIIDFTAKDALVYMTKYERALMRRDAKCAICVPVFADVLVWNQAEADRPAPVGVLAIDSDEALTNIFTDELLEDLLIERTKWVYEALMQEANDG